MNIPELLQNQRHFFNTDKTRDISYLKDLLKALKAEVLNREDAIYEALNKDFGKSKFETYLSEIGIVLSEVGNFDTAGNQTAEFFSQHRIPLTELKGLGS